MYWDAFVKPLCVTNMHCFLLGYINSNHRCAALKVLPCTRISSFAINVGFALAPCILLPARFSLDDLSPPLSLGRSRRKLTCYADRHSTCLAQHMCCNIPVTYFYGRKWMSREYLKQIHILHFSRAKCSSCLR